MRVAFPSTSRPRSGLSAKLLVMTIAFVMLAEAVIFIPSVALYRQSWLADRGEAAGLISLAITGVPGYTGGQMLSKQFMADTDVILVAGKMDEGAITTLVLGEPPEMTSAQMTTVDARQFDGIPDFGAALSTLLGLGPDYIRVIDGSPVASQSTLEYIVPRNALTTAMRDYFRRIFALSLIIAVITGSLIYLALSGMIVRPVRELAAQLVRFREDPLVQKSFGPRSRRADEIGDLQREFADMKAEIRSGFAQRERLATLGLAVAKINHDLRNTLTSAQLASDRLATHPDEKVRRTGERLVRVIDRGIRICTETLGYSSEKERPSKLESIRISSFLGEVAADTLGEYRNLKFINRIPSELCVMGDPDKTYRVFHNLFRNAGQAMASTDGGKPHQLLLKASIQGERAHIGVRDTGPGLPQVTVDNLFTPFASASGVGSTGLGLSISKDLAVSQGGDLELAESGPEGTEFRVSFALAEA